MQIFLQKIISGVGKQKLIFVTCYKKLTSSGGHVKTFIDIVYSL